MTTAFATDARFASAPAEAREYCCVHQITEYAELALRLACESFPPGSGISFRVEADPESDAQWLVADVSVPPGADATACYERFLGRWLAEATPYARDRIRLTFLAG